MAFFVEIVFYYLVSAKAFLQELKNDFMYDIPLSRYRCCVIVWKYYCKEVLMCGSVLNNFNNRKKRVIIFVVHIYLLILCRCVNVKTLMQ